MKILQLIPQFVFPHTDGGKIGIANIFKQFSKNANVTLFSLSNKKIEDKYLDEAAKYGKTYIQFANTKNNFSNLFKSIFTKEPLYLFKHQSKAIRKKLTKIIEKNEFDIIHADHTAMASLALYLKETYGIPCGLRLHNIEYKIWERYADVLKPGSLKHKFVSRQSRLLKHREAELIEKMDVCFAITDVDKRRALSLAPNANVKVASAGIDPEKWFTGKLSQRNANRVIIASTWQWVHNIDGLNWFTEEVLPLIKSQINDVQLHVLGNDPPKSIFNNFNIEPRGFVDNILQEFHRSNVYVAPLFVGSGIRIKILEAMAAGLPVVATSVSAEGITAGNKDGLFVSDDAKTQASIIVSLMKNKSQAYELGLKANEYINKYYTWEQNVQVMVDQYQKIIRK